MTLTVFRKYLSTLLIFCWMIVGFSQNNEMRSYGLEEGLPQSQVYDVVQDEKGYLWLATQGGGISRFDGDTFLTYNDKSGIASNYIFTLHSSGDSLFIGHKQGLSLKLGNRFQNFKLPQVNDIEKGAGLTVLATEKGLYEMNAQKIPQRVVSKKEIDDQAIKAILFDGYYFWVATSKGLWRIDKTKTTWNAELYLLGNFTSLTRKNKTLWAATFTDGIYEIDLQKKVDDRIVAVPRRVNNITLLHDQLWVSTDASGVEIYDANTFQMIKNLDRNHGLGVSHIRRILLDRQGAIWIATSGGGLYKYFQNEFTHYDKDTGLKGNRVYATHFDGHRLWASNSEAGLVSIDSLGIHPIPPIEGFDNVKMKTIKSDFYGNLWVGSDGKGILFRENIERDTLIVQGEDISDIKVETISEVKNHIINEKDDLPSNWIRQLYVQEDTTWVATYSLGIVKLQYNEREEKLTLFKTFGLEDGMEDLLIRDMKPDAQGRIWYATDGGHLGYIEDDTLTHLGQVLQQKVPINTILFRNSTLYLGTAGKGIWYASEENIPQFKKLRGAKELTSNNSYQLLFDYEENLWMGTERGVDKIILNKENEIVDVFHFGRNDGFLGIETCLNAAEKDNQGNLWFGAIYGLTKYDARKGEGATSIKPKLFFEEINIGYQSVDSIPYFTTHSDAVLRLTPDETQIAFQYKSVDLSHPNEIEYRYQLNDTEWSPWSRNTQQNFAGLAFGAHTFKAQSRNFRWQESDPIQFSFFIESPLHKKAWFQWSMVVLALLLLGSITWMYIRRVKKKNSAERQQLELQNHLLSLEQKALQLQMNPHFIFNVLNGIKAMGTDHQEKRNKTINSFATMLREVLYNSRKESISLSQEIKTLRNYIEVEQLMAVKPFVYDILVASELDAEEILIPPMIIQPFVENAIRHGIQKSSKEGKLEIKFETKGDFLSCEITDNGPGIYESQKSKKATDHQSMALTVTRERIESLSGKDALKIEELKTNNEILGTKVTFKIPLETDF